MGSIFVSTSGVRMGGWSIGHPPPTPTTLEKFLRTPLDVHLVHIDDKNTVTKTLLKPGETIFWTEDTPPPSFSYPAQLSYSATHIK